MASRKPLSSGGATRAAAAGPARSPSPSRKPGRPSAASSIAASAPPLDADALGSRLRHARMVQQLTLKALAEQAGCSESLLSKVEGGHATPSLATLHRIALALDTNIATLVSGPGADVTPVQRASERPSVRFPAVQARAAKGGRPAPAIMLERLIVPGPGQLLQGDIHVLEPLARSDEQISHIGEELGYVLEGELELTLGDQCYRLQAGDSFYFPSTEPHSYRNPGECTTRVLWINTPPTF